MSDTTDKACPIVFRIAFEWSHPYWMIGEWHRKSEEFLPSEWGMPSYCN